MVRTVRESDRTSVAEAAKKHRRERTDALHVAQEVGNMNVADAKRLKSLEAENARLKKLLDERDLEVMKEIAAKKVVSSAACAGGTQRASHEPWQGTSPLAFCGLPGASQAPASTCCGESAAPAPCDR